MERSASGWWIVFGALAGAIFAIAVLMAPPLMPDLDLRDVAPWQLVFYGDSTLLWLIGCGVGGLFLGGFLGSRALRMTRRVRTGFGALCGAAVGVAAGGSLFLFVEVAGEDWPSGLAAFVTGAIVGGFAGLVVGGLLGARTAGAS